MILAIISFITVWGPEIVTETPNPSKKLLTNGAVASSVAGKFVWLTSLWWYYKPYWTTHQYFIKNYRVHLWKLNLFINDDCHKNLKACSVSY